MTKTFELIGGIMLLLGIFEFARIGPKGAFEQVHRIMTSPSPRIVGGHLVMPRKEPGGANLEKRKSH